VTDGQSEDGDEVNQEESEQNKKAHSDAVIRFILAILWLLSFYRCT